MGLTGSERRLLENEVVFRQFNRSIQDGVNQINKAALEEGEAPIDFDGNLPLYFYCECSDEDCRKRIRLSPNRYNEIHSARNIFVVLNGHEVGSIEEVIDRRDDYCVVRKLKVPPEDVTGLNKTDVHNV